LVFGRGVESRSKDARKADFGGFGKRNSVFDAGAEGRPNDSFVGAADKGANVARPGRAVLGLKSRLLGPSTGLSSTLGLREPVSYALPRPRTSSSSSSSTRFSLMTEVTLRMLDIEAFEL
jgi:hypothetical protein